MGAPEVVEPAAGDRVHGADAGGLLAAARMEAAVDGRALASEQARDALVGFARKEADWMRGGREPEELELDLPARLRIDVG